MNSLINRLLAITSPSPCPGDISVIYFFKQCASVKFRSQLADCHADCQPILAIQIRRCKYALLRRFDPEYIPQRSVVTQAVKMMAHYPPFCQAPVQTSYRCKGVPTPITVHCWKRSHRDHCHVLVNCGYNEGRRIRRWMRLLIEF